MQAPLAVAPGVVVLSPIAIAPVAVAPTTPAPAVAACGGANLVANGSFEDGFVGGVGKGWSSFTNGGAATYGFYDEMWTKVIKDGSHGQLIEINSYDRGASDPEPRGRNLPGGEGPHRGRHL